VVLTGPHFNFTLHRSMIEVVRNETSGVWHAALVDAELLSVGDPGEPLAAVVAALGPALCELWCAFSLRPPWDEHRDLYRVGRQLVQCLLEVTERSDPLLADHARGVLPSDLLNLANKYQSTIDDGIFGRKGVLGGSDR
jgi:hypothetical protein